MSPGRASALACLGGTLTFLSFPEWDLFPLAWVCLLPLLFVIEGQSPRAAFGWGWLHGLVTNCGGFYWVIHLLRQFGHLPLVAAVAVFLLLAAYQACLFGIWAALCRLLEDNSPLPRSLLRIASFVACEFSMPFLFPWYLGNSQWTFPLATQICDLGGVLAVSALLVTCSVLLHEALSKRAVARPRLLLLGLLVAGDFGYGAIRIHQLEAQMAAAEKQTIGLVEANIGIREKAIPAHVTNNLILHQRLSKLLEDGGADLVVWPESAYGAAWFPTSTARIPPAQTPLPSSEAWQAISIPPSGHLVLEGFAGLDDAQIDPQLRLSRAERVAPQRGFRSPLLLGVVTYAPEPKPLHPGRRWQRRIMNSAMLLDSEGGTGGRLYHKNYLLAFGEYIPFGSLLPQLYDMIPAASSFTAGTEVEAFQLGPLRAGVMICYEGILPRWTARLVAEKNPNVLINITNDAWFGKRGEPWLHLALTTFRAIEHRKAFVRSTNTGISAFVDPVGRLTAHSSVEHAEVLLAEVPLLEGRTVYGHIGDVLGWLALALLLGGPLVARRRRARAPSETEGLDPAPLVDAT